MGVAVHDGYWAAWVKGGFVTRNRNGMEKAVINYSPPALASSLNPNAFRRIDIAVIICVINYVQEQSFHPYAKGQMHAYAYALCMVCMVP